jgi:hypothetical protein
LAKKPEPSLADIQKGFGTDIKFKSYKNDGKGLDELKESHEIVGVFLSVKDNEITDKRTKQRKVVRVYSIRGEDGRVMKIGSRALLDGVFDDIMDENGGFQVENNRYKGPGIDWIQNKMVKFVRGEDSKNSNGDRMGTYEIQVEE